MSARGRTSSPARSEASRRNGSLGKGPQTALGKLKASQNARKHGLFCDALVTGARLPAGHAQLEDLLARRAGGWLDHAGQSEVVTIASAQLDRVTRILADMRGELDQLMMDEAVDDERLGQLVKEIARMARYQHRFRGRRDRALRRLLADAPASKA